MNKRGMSGIVTTVIMIVLVMVAIGVVWGIVSKIMEGGEGQIGLSSDCLAVNIKPTKATCTAAGVCDVTVKREAGGKEIGGIKLIFSSAGGGDSSPQDFPGAISPLATKTFNAIPTGMTNVDKVEVAVYFLDESGKEQLCSPSNPLEF